MIAPEKPTMEYYHSTVDTSRPFRSVKEAVAIFGERLLAAEIYSPKPFSFPKQQIDSWTFSPSPKLITKGDEDGHHTLAETLKKLKSELEETKMELKLLKERESETEVALASLNAELHKNMSKMAQAEAAAAAKAVEMAVAARLTDGVREEERRDLIVRVENSPTLSQIPSIREKKEGLFGGKMKENKKMMKKKPIIPLVGDLFSRKKVSSATLHNPLYSSSQVCLN